MKPIQHQWLTLATVRPWLGAAAGLVIVGLLGCHRIASLTSPAQFFPPAPQPIEVPVSNPTQVPLVDATFLWNQVVDTVDDFFRIDDEQPLRRTNTDWLEGRLVTYPEVSGTSIEPWRSDTARGFERLQSTFLTVRRRATVRVINEESGYSINVEVIKEQEDVDQSQFSTSGTAVQTSQGAIVRTDNQVRQMPITLGWYEIGRDRELEQRIMANILGRISNVGPPHQPLLGRGIPK